MRRPLPALSFVALLFLVGCSISSSCTHGVTLKITGPQWPRPETDRYQCSRGLPRKIRKIPAMPRKLPNGNS